MAFMHADQLLSQHTRDTAVRGVAAFGNLSQVLGGQFPPMPLPGGSPRLLQGATAGMSMQQRQHESHLDSTITVGGANTWARRTLDDHIEKLRTAETLKGAINRGFKDDPNGYGWFLAATQRRLEERAGKETALKPILEHIKQLPTATEDEKKRRMSRGKQ